MQKTIYIFLFLFMNTSLHSQSFFDKVGLLEDAQKIAELSCQIPTIDKKNQEHFRLAMDKLMAVMEKISLGMQTKYKNWQDDEEVKNLVKEEIQKGLESCGTYKPLIKIDSKEIQFVIASWTTIIYSIKIK